MKLRQIKKKEFTLMKTIKEDYLKNIRIKFFR